MATASECSTNSTANSNQRPKLEPTVENEVRKGCSCKKSKCEKHYCGCYKVGIGCTIKCKCEGCKNSYGEKPVLAPPAEEESESQEEESESKEESESQEDPEN